MRRVLLDMARAPGRSSVVVIAAALVAVLGTASALIGTGARNGLEQAAARLGADVLVIPSATEEKVDNALLLGVPTDARLPLTKVNEVASIEGVAAVSPQLFLASLPAAPCCPDQELLMIAFDPATDFAVRPWLDKSRIDSLAVDELVGGFNVDIPEGEKKIKLYGYPLALRANLARTGTSLDRSVYLTLASAKAIAASSKTTALKPLVIPDGQASALLVKVTPGTDPSDVAIAIADSVDGVETLFGNRMFASVRQQVAVVGRILAAALVVVGLLSFALVWISATMAARERRRETGVLRALGATRADIIRAFTAEAVVLSAVGATLGTLGSAGLVYLYQGYLASTVHIPLELPTAPVAALGAIVAVSTVTLLVSAAYALAVIGPSFQDPAVAMREQ